MQLPGLSVHLSKQDTLRMSSQQSHVSSKLSVPTKPPASVRGSEYVRDTTLEELEKAINEITELNGEALPVKPKEEVQKDIIRAALEQADFLIQAKKQAEPDTYPET